MLIVFTTLYKCCFNYFLLDGILLDMSTDTHSIVIEDLRVCRCNCSCCVFLCVVVDGMCHCAVSFILSSTVGLSQFICCVCTSTLKTYHEQTAHALNTSLLK